jgi:dihydropyrimidinase
MYTRGVLGKRISVQQLIAKCCTNPAKIMGLYPQKGVIAAGSDADIAVVDPKLEFEVDHAKMETGADWNPYQGMRLAGFAQHTFCRGRQIVDNYKCVDAKGWGRWLPREKAGSI